MRSCEQLWKDLERWANGEEIPDEDDLLAQARMEELFEEEAAEEAAEMEAETRREERRAARYKARSEAKRFDRNPFGDGYLTRCELSGLFGIPIGTLKRWDHESRTRPTFLVGRRIYYAEEALRLIGGAAPIFQHKTRERLERVGIKLIRAEVERMSRMVRRIDGLIKERDQKCTTTLPTSERGLESSSMISKPARSPTPPPVLG